MEHEDKLYINERYRDRLERYGPGIKALASGTEERRKIRFDALVDVGIKDGVSVLDVGCGFADFYGHLKSRGISVNYTGIDIVPDLIERTKDTYPNLNLEVRDLQEYPFPSSSFDFVVCSQVFNLNLGLEKNNKLVEDMLAIMHKMARNGVAVDFLTEYVDFKQDHLFYYQPEKIFELSKKLTRCVTLKHDYPLFEFCVYLYPNFKGWNNE